MVSLCTLGAANTWTLIQIPNLLVFSNSFAWTLSPGNVGYTVSIALAAGSSLITPVNGIWTTGFLGALGQSNFGASPVSSTFDIAFLQHEPGPVCTTPNDIDFVTNLRMCSRYFQKSYSYGTATSAASPGEASFYVVASQQPLAAIVFPTRMAKVPTVSGYSPVTGAVNNVRNATTAADLAIASTVAPGDAGFNGFALTTAPAAAAIIQFQWAADSGW